MGVKLLFGKLFEIFLNFWKLHLYVFNIYVIIVLFKMCLTDLLICFFNNIQSSFHLFLQWIINLLDPLLQIRDISRISLTFNINLFELLDIWFRLFWWWKSKSWAISWENIAWQLGRWMLAHWTSWASRTNIVCMG